MVSVLGDLTLDKALKGFVDSVRDAYRAIAKEESEKTFTSFMDAVAQFASQGSRADST